MPDAVMSEYSYRSLKIHTLNHDKRPVAEATCFPYKRSGRYYVVTNWHVVYGKNPVDETFLQGCSSDNRPLWLRVLWPQAQATSTPTQVTLPLYHAKRLTDGGEPYPLFQTPDGLFATVMPHTDVAVLPISDDQSHLFEDHYYDGDGVSEAQLSVTDTVYVVGYPTNSGALPGRPPVWTRGSIASEPDVAEGRAHLLVDSRTRPGQSGSPVIQYRRGFAHTAEGGFREVFEEKGTLVGVYSGRTDKESDLGRIWSPSEINHAIDTADAWL